MMKQVRRVCLPLLLCLASVQPTWSLGGEIELERVPEPLLDQVDQAVRTQLVTRREALAGLLHEKTAGAADLAFHFGELGGLYLLYDFPSSAEAALEIAHELAPEEFRWSYLLGFFFENEGRLTDAVELIDQSLDVRPRNLAALIRSGTAHLELGALEAASQRFSSALEVSRSCAAAHYGLGKIAVATSDWLKAVGHFEKALELQPNATAVHYPLSQTHRQLGDADKAREHLLQMGSTEVSVPEPELLRLRGLATGASVHFVRGKRALSRGALELAEEEFAAAVGADPENASMRRGYGLTLKKLGRIAEAIVEYEVALSLEPANPINHQDLGLAHIEAGGLQSARSSFQRALELDSSFAEAYLALGIVDLRENSIDAALENFERALDLSPLNTEVMAQKSLALLRAGRLGQAKESFRQLLEADAEHPVAHINLARIYEQEGDLEAAAIAAREGLKRSPPAGLSARANLLLGRVSERLQDFSQALGYYEKAVELDANLLPAHTRLGSILARKENFVGAVHAYNEALKLHPTYQAAQRAKASALMYAEQYADAKLALETGLRISPNDPFLMRTLALLLATCPDESIRSAERSLELARRAFSSNGDITSAQILVMAYAGNQMFEEAVRGQERLLAQLRREGKGSQEASSSERLALYVAGREVRAPWRIDDSLIESPILPLPSIPH
jgi:tetratricopeptide (TPR) repeat protein